MKQIRNLWKKYSYVFLLAFLLLGLFDLRFALAAVVCMAAPILISVFKGRYWCGNLCPRGSFYDNILIKFSNKRKVPKFLKSYYFRGIMVIFIITMFSFGMKNNWGNLYGIGMVFYRIILVTTIVGIVLSLFYNQRSWCHFCPMGTIASFIAKIRKSKNVLQVSGQCVSCKICGKKCSMGIVPYEYKGDILSHPDCIHCGKCVSVCPKDAIGYDVVEKCRQ